MFANIKKTLYEFFSYLLPRNIIFTDVLEIIIIAFFIYYIILWIRDSKAWSLLKGMVFLIVLWIVSSVFQFNAIQWIFVNALNVGIILLIIIFQPELRRALEQLGRRNFISLDFKGNYRRFSDKTLSEIVQAVFAMAEVKTGALIAIEIETSLGEYERTGIDLDATVSSGLLINIFEHNTPLHDGAVIIKGDKIVSATCILPVSDNMQLSKELGTRHRAGVGLAEVTDAFVIIVSEETGKVSVARNGQLHRGIDEMYLKSKLTEMQMSSAVVKAKKDKTDKAGKKKA